MPHYRSHAYNDFDLVVTPSAISMRIIVLWHHFLVRITTLMLRTPVHTAALISCVGTVVAGIDVGFLVVVVPGTALVGAP